MTVPTSMLEHALAYAARGWRVLPLKGKFPRIKDWPNAATTDEATIRKWWKTWPDANIGISTCEKSGIFVLDIDGEDGEKTLAALGLEIPATLVSRTGGGGRHMLFSYPAEKMGNSVRRLGDCLDTRGSGGMIVVAPSVHPDTGALYEWEDESAPVVAPPEALLALLRKPEPPPPPPYVRREVGEGRAAKYRQSLLDGVTADLRGTPKGERNILLYRKCARLGNFSDACDLSETEAMGAVLDAIRGAGWDNEKLSRKTMSNGWKRGIGCLKQIPDRPGYERPTKPAPVTPLPPRPPVEGTSALKILPSVATATAPTASDRGPYPAGYRKVKMADWLTHFGVDAVEVEWQNGRKWKFAQCVWNPEHTDAGASQRTEGAIAAWCQHPDCAGKKWSDLREALDPKGAPKMLKVREPRTVAIPDIVATMPENLHEMLANYVALVGTDGIYDRRTGRRLTMSALKLAHDVDAKAWAECQDRLRVDVDRLVFKPGGADPGEFNLFTGLPKIEVVDRSGVTAWFEHIDGMAPSGDIGLWLRQRLAYKMQNPGLKVASSIVIHGAQGTGKNLLFEPLLAIYGQYGGVITQTQIESPYTDWLSRKLLLVADEVANRGERYHVKNKLKGLITNPKIAIDEKFQAVRWEDNFADIHFLSNEDIPIVVEPGDRRFCVIKYDVVRDAAYFRRLAAVDPGALYEALMEMDCSGFHAHTKPPETSAKEDIRTLTKEPSDRFLDEWLANELPIPAVEGAAAPHLYKAYQVWSVSRGEKKVIQSNVEFGRIVGKRLTHMKIRLGDSTPWAWSITGERPTAMALRDFHEALIAWLDVEQKARV